MDIVNIFLFCIQILDLPIDYRIDLQQPELNLENDKYTKIVVIKSHVFMSQKS